MIRSLELNYDEAGKITLNDTSDTFHRLHFLNKFHVFCNAAKIFHDKLSIFFFLLEKKRKVYLSITILLFLLILVQHHNLLMRREERSDDVGIEVIKATEQTEMQ